MNFVIDYDTRKVECKSSDPNLLADYIMRNGLEMAVTLISCEDDLVLEMSFKELVDLHENLVGESRHFDDPEHAADIIWSELVMEADKFPTFDKRVEKKLLKQAAARSKDGKQESAKATGKGKLSEKTPKKEKRVSGKRVTKKQLQGKLLTVGDVEPTGRGMRMQIREYLELEGEVSFETLLEDLSFETGKEEKSIIPYVTGGIGKGFIKIVE